MYYIPHLFFLYPRDISTHNNFCLTIFIIFIFLFCFLCLVFDIYIMCVTFTFNKRWFSERFSLLSRYEVLLLENFLFCFSVLNFYTITNFYSHSHRYYYDYFYYYCFRHCHCHYFLTSSFYHFFIFNDFNLYFSSFYHSILSLYISNIFKL